MYAPKERGIQCIACHRQDCMGQVVKIEKNCYMIKVVVNKLYPLCVGDKLSGRAQKGVVSLLAEQENLPFCERTGMTPDLLINPVAFPSRMTMGYLLEIKEATCMASTKHYSSQNGVEVMINGASGEKMQVPLFMGIVTYQRVKQIATTKVQVRGNSGAVDPITGQPSHGKKRGGGLAIGSMEISALHAHNVPNCCEKILNLSDMKECFVCRQCKTWLYLQNNKTCNRCKGHDIKTIKMTHSFRAMAELLFGCGVMIDVE